MISDSPRQVVVSRADTRFCNRLSNIIADSVELNCERDDDWLVAPDCGSANAGVTYLFFRRGMAIAL
jgi:hypothetical protein